MVLGVVVYAGKESKLMKNGGEERVEIFNLWVKEVDKNVHQYPIPNFNHVISKLQFLFFFENL